MMTYNHDNATVKNAIEAARASGRYLPGDGFDKNDAPLLDRYITRLGYMVIEVEKCGNGQLKSVTTACQMVISRNGYAHSKV